MSLLGQRAAVSRTTNRRRRVVARCWISERPHHHTGGTRTNVFSALSSAGASDNARPPHLVILCPREFNNAQHWASRRHVTPRGRVSAAGGRTSKVTGRGVDVDERSERAALIPSPCTVLFCMHSVKPYRSGKVIECRVSLNPSL